MNTLLLIAALHGPQAPQPNRTAWIVVEPAQAESKVLLSEWERDWPLERTRWECECYFKFRVVDRSRLSGVTNVPCLILGEQQYPIKANFSCQAMHELGRAVQAFVVESDEAELRELEYWEHGRRWPL